MNKKYVCWSLLSFALVLSACKKDDDGGNNEPAKKNTIPEFYQAAVEADYGKNEPGISLIADANNDVNIPQDLDFNPHRNGELWILNKDINSSGGSTVTISNAGEANQSFDWRRDGNAWHFMALPSALAFSPTFNTWASTANIQDANRQGGSFTGPSLWSTEMDVYARPSGGNGSHLDMLHGSPFSMGIAAEKDNIFWVYDGYYGHLVRYDFVDDHGPGNDDHSDGKVHRYTEVELMRTSNPSHMVLDADKRWLYIVDGGTKKIKRVDIKTGNKTGDLDLINEYLAEHWEMKNVNQEDFITSGLNEPVGIEIKGNRLFVSDYSNGDIICYDINTRKELGRINTGKKGIMGIKIGPKGKLWYVNADSDEVFRVDPR